MGLLNHFRLPSSDMADQTIEGMRLHVLDNTLTEAIIKALFGQSRAVKTIFLQFLQVRNPRCFKLSFEHILVILPHGDIDAR